MKAARRLIAISLALFLLLAQLPLSVAASKTYTGTLNKDNVFFRSKASKTSSYILRFKKGDKVQVSAISGSFYQVTYNGKTGYVMRTYVDLSASDKKALENGTTNGDMEGITKISQIDVPASSKKGDSGAKVKALQQALKIKKYYTWTVNGKFDNNTVTAVKAFQKANHLTQTGKADYDTIYKLFGKKAADFRYTTQKLDWFNGGSTVIPRGATFIVKDVLTGKTFNCKRLYGANHMDTEPLTKKDTATMKSIYGGMWGWARRAVLVKYKDHVYAGSMNGMPHGNCSIKNNNFDGHFCIHFSGSKTHGTKRVDAAHQNAVKRALRATW
ncbi:MAG: peptidoglycan-binding protein [Clostridia bacterium]|nr:peptidoglycan-binding protein [Clostridia bacterium]